MVMLVNDERILRCEVTSLIEYLFATDPPSSNDSDMDYTKHHAASTYRLILPQLDWQDQLQGDTCSKKAVWAAHTSALLGRLPDGVTHFVNKAPQL